MSTSCAPDHSTCRGKPVAFWLAVAYALALIQSPGLHDHGAGHAPRAEATCEASGVHLAHHHDAPDLSEAAEPCPACHYRVLSPLLLDRMACLLDRSEEPCGLARAPLSEARRLLHASSRAPPRV